MAFAISNKDKTFNVTICLSDSKSFDDTSVCELRFESINDKSEFETYIFEKESEEQSFVKSEEQSFVKSEERSLGETELIKRHTQYLEKFKEDFEFIEKMRLNIIADIRLQVMTNKKALKDSLKDKMCVAGKNCLKSNSACPFAHNRAELKKNMKYKLCPNLKKGCRELYCIYSHSFSEIFEHARPCFDPNCKHVSVVRSVNGKILYFNKKGDPMICWYVHPEETMENFLKRSYEDMPELLVI
jgi:hypothetical protein